MVGVPKELQELRSKGNFLLPDRQLPLKDSTSHASEKKCCRLGTKKQPPREGRLSEMYFFERGRLFCPGSPRKGRLLPLNSCAWFWRHIVANAVNSLNLCQDSVCDLHKDWPVDLLDGCSHSVYSVYGADDYRPVI